jgi:hypothetical protein
MLYGYETLSVCLCEHSLARKWKLLFESTHVYLSKKLNLILTHVSVCLFTYVNIQYFACSFVWVRNLVSHTKRKTD